jgi:hypothetical protein
MLDLLSVPHELLLDNLAQKVALKLRECTGGIHPQLLVLEQFSRATRTSDHHVDACGDIC